MITVLQDEFERLVGTLGLEVGLHSVNSGRIKDDWSSPLPFHVMYDRLFRSSFYAGVFVMNRRGFSILLDSVPVPQKPLRISINFEIILKPDLVSVIGEVFSIKYHSRKSGVRIFPSVSDFSDFLKEEDRRGLREGFEGLV